MFYLGTTTKSCAASFLYCCKVVGWEILDIRYVGMIARVKTAIDSIHSYISGEIMNIEKILEPRELSVVSDIQQSLPDGKFCRI